MTIAALLTVGLAWGCADDAQAPPTVAASNALVADWVRAVAGEAIEVVVLGKSEGDAHHWESTPSDASRVRAAAVTFAVGLGLDPGAVALARSAGGSRVVVELGAGLERAERAQAGAPAPADGHKHDHGHDHGAHPTDAHAQSASHNHSCGLDDPHFWHDPKRVAQAVDRIDAALAKAWPQRRDEFARRATAYKGELAALDEWIGKKIAALPQERRTIVATHDGLGYFGDRYGLRILGIEMSGDVASADPSPMRVAGLVKEVRESGATVLFAEPGHALALERAVAHEAAIPLVDCLRLDGLPAKAGEKSQADAEPAGAAYLAMMRSNVDCIVEGLAK
jgi:ABC-type Zn uptake system ZnuABC Zn-binding protein ZnuA